MAQAVHSHILVIDDDPQIRSLLQEYLAENGLRVSAAATGDEMSRILNDEAIDLVVLDLRLAGEDGMAIARSLRDRSAIPIVMLTGVRDEADRVMGLELGADDYLTKPFSPRELLARIRTVLRRTKSAAAGPARQREVRAYRFGEFELNLRTRRLKRGNGSHIELTNGEFNLLAALLAAPERILSRRSAVGGEPRVRQRSLRSRDRHPGAAIAAQNRTGALAAPLHRHGARRGLHLQLPRRSGVLSARFAFVACQPPPSARIRSTLARSCRVSRLSASSWFCSRAVCEVTTVR